MPSTLLQPFEEKARREFLRDFEKIREKFELPSIEEIEEKIRLCFPTLRKSVGIRVEDALLIMLRTAFDNLAAQIAQFLFPQNPIHAIESPFEKEEEKKEARKRLLELLKIYWEITKTVREGSLEEKIKMFKEYFEKFKEYDEYIGKLIKKVIEKIEKDLKKVEKEEKMYFR